MFKFDAFFHGCLLRVDVFSICSWDQIISEEKGINGSNNIARLDTAFTAKNNVVEISFLSFWG
jgi:hypothetical protein